MEQGFIQAQNSLGIAYSKGKGVPMDMVEGIKWFRKAADQGHAEAQYNLSACYMEGRGVGKDFSLCMIWLMKAAYQGHPDAIKVLQTISNK